MKKIFNLNVFIFLGLILGVLGGFFLPKFMPKISFIGDVYINLLKLILLPVIFTTVSLSIYKSLANKKLGVLKAIFLFVFIFIIVFIFTAFVFKYVNLGSNYNIGSEEYETEVEKFEIGKFFSNTFQDSFIDIIKDNNILFMIIFAGIFAFASSKIEKSKKIIDIIEAISEVLNKIVEYIIYITPIAIIPLIGNVVASYGSEILGTTLKYIALVYLLSIIVIVLLTLLVLSRVKTVSYVRKLFKIGVMSFSTCSSLATLPFALKLLKEEKNIDKEKADVIFPLGVAISKIGGAISFAALAMFTSQIYGIPITITQFILMIVLAILINFSAAGLPGGGIVVGAAYTASLGMPLGFIGIYAGIYRLLDMAYTTVNMNANINITALLSRKKNIEIK